MNWSYSMGASKGKWIRLYHLSGSVYSSGVTLIFGGAEGGGGGREGA